MVFGKEAWLIARSHASMFAFRSSGDRMNAGLQAVKLRKTINISSLPDFAVLNANTKPISGGTDIDLTLFRFRNILTTVRHVIDE